MDLWSQREEILWFRVTSARNTNMIEKEKEGSKPILLRLPCSKVEGPTRKKKEKHPGKFGVRLHIIYARKRASAKASQRAS